VAFATEDIQQNSGVGALGSRMPLNILNETVAFATECIHEDSGVALRRAVMG